METTRSALAEDVSSGRPKAVLERLEGLLKRLGLTPFSSKIAVGFLKQQLEREGGADRMARAVAYMLDHLNGAAFAPAAGAAVVDWQRGCPNRLRGLRAHPLWSRDALPWLLQLEECAPVILQEFLAARSEGADGLFQPYRSPRSSAGSDINTGSTTSESRPGDALGDFATDSGSWNVCYLQLHGVDFESNIARFPATMSAVQRLVPRPYSHTFISALSAGAHISAHYGPTNKKLRLHLPLLVPQGRAWLRVAGELVELSPGSAFVFDDSHEHEAGNDSADAPRVVLVIDFWHPDLTDEEVRFLQFINAAQVLAARRMAAAAESAGEDFLSVILAARGGAVPAEDVWGHRVVDD